MTDVLNAENTLLIRVADHMSSFVLPYGKQNKKRGGMWYTPVSGIWQTVWLKRVPNRFMEAIEIETGLHWAEIAVKGDVPDGRVVVKTPEGEREFPLISGRTRLDMEQPCLWSPEEPYLYHCDICAGEDRVSGHGQNGDYHFLRDTALPTIDWKKRSDRWMHRDQETRTAFLRAMEQTVMQLKNHPCICYWTVFNEGWGQFESTKAYRRMRELDPTRVVAGVSGWFKGGESDVITEHVYFKPFRPVAGDKPLVLSEFGGYAYQCEGHIFDPENEYGYRKYENQEDYVSGLVELYEKEIIPAVEQGLCGAIYTQLSDVEDETNGLLTYDRKVCKVDAENLLTIARTLQERCH